MAHLQIEQRRDGSLLLSSRRGGRGGVATAGVIAGLLLLGGVAVAETTVLAVVVALPVGLITLLAGIAAARHRDWIIFDRPARQVVFRRGLASIFRPVSAFAFDEVETIHVQPVGGTADGVMIELVRAGDFGWPIDTSADPAHVDRLVTALREVGGWPVVRAGESAAVK